MATVVPTCHNSYMVTWESEGTLFLNELRSVLSNTKIYPTDITLASEGRFFPAHKLLLSVCSTYLRETIEKHVARFPTAVIVLTDVSANSINYILKFIYNGQVDIKEEYADQFFQAGNTLKIQGLLKKDVTFTRHLEVDDLFGDLGYSKPPATPGRSLSQPEKTSRLPTKDFKASSSSVHATCDQRQTHKHNNKLRQSDSDSHKTIEIKEAGKNDHKLNSNAGIKKSEEITTTKIFPTAMPRMKKGPHQQSANKDGSDSDSDSDGNMFHCDDDYVSPLDDDSSVDENYKEPELIVIDDEIDVRQQKPENSTSKVVTPSSISSQVHIFECKRNPSSSTSSLVKHCKNDKKAETKSKATKEKNGILPNSKDVIIASQKSNQSKVISVVNKHPEPKHSHTEQSILVDSKGKPDKLIKVTHNTNKRRKIK